MTELQVRGVRQLGQFLGVSKTVAAELAKQPWFPAKGPDGSWATAEVTKAYAEFKEGRLAPPAAPTVPTREIAPAGPALDENALRDVLEREEDPEKIAIAVMQLFARTLGRAGTLTAGHAIAMKATMEEARKSAAGYLKLAQERGELIKRDVAKTVIGGIVRRSVLILERYEVELAQRVEAWLGDEKFRSMTSEERARAVREWAVEKSYALRKIEATELERLVADEVKEQAKK